MVVLTELEENTTLDIPAIDGEEAISERPKDVVDDGHSISNNIIEPSPIEAENGGLIVAFAPSKIQTDDKVKKSNLGKKINKLIANMTSSWKSPNNNRNPPESGQGKGGEANLKRSNSLNVRGKSKVKQNSYRACYSFRREGNNGTKKTDPELAQYLEFWH